MATGPVDDVALRQRQVVGPGGLIGVQHHHWTDREMQSRRASVTCAGTSKRPTFVQVVGRGHDIVVHRGGQRGDAAVANFIVVQWERRGRGWDLQIFKRLQEDIFL